MPGVTPAVEIVIAFAAMAMPHGSERIRAARIDRLVIEHRLAHAHENHAANRMRAIGLNFHDLIDDLPSRQIAAKADSAGCAKLAAHRATHLRTDANHALGIILPMQKRNANRLERFRAVAVKQILGEAVARRNDFFEQASNGESRFLGEPAPALGGQARPRLGILAAPHRRRLNPTRRRRFQAEMLEIRVQLLGSEVFEKQGHGTEVRSPAFRRNGF